MNTQKIIASVLLALSLLVLPNLAKAAGTYDGKYEGEFKVKYQGEVTRVFARLTVTDNDPVLRFFRIKNDAPGDRYLQFSAKGFVDSHGVFYGVLVDDRSQDIVSGFGGRIAGQNDRHIIGKFVQRNYSHSFRLNEVD